MNYVRSFWYGCVGLFWRLAALMLYPFAWFGWETPVLYAIFNIMLYDELASDAWDGAD